MRKVYRGLEYHKYRILTFLVGVSGIVILFSSCSNSSNNKLLEESVINQDSVVSDSANVEANQDTINLIAN